MGNRSSIRRSYTAQDTRPVVVSSRTSGCTPFAYDLFIPHVPLFFIDVDVGHLVGKFLPVPDAPFNEEVILNPDNLIDGPEEGGLALEG